MRCEKCGAEVEPGELCAVCAEAARRPNVGAYLSTVMAVVSLLMLPLIWQRYVASVIPAVGLAFAGFIMGAKAGTTAKSGRCRETAFSTVGMCLSGAAFLATTASAFVCIILPDPVRPRQLRHLNNIKYLALAAMQYSEDHHETFPGWVQNPDGRMAHNVWDQQIASRLRFKDAYSDLPGSGKGIRSYSQPGKHDRVLTYGLNGLLIAPQKGDSSGNTDFAAFGRGSSPYPLSPSAVANPSGTILFAELKTQDSMPGVYGQAPDPKPYTYKPGKTSRGWLDALDGWIDISPRDFVVITQPIANNYTEPFSGATDRGVARDLYGGGGSYAFCDGHAKFLKVSQSVGIGTEVNGRMVTPENCWKAWNTNNMWIPQ